MFFTGRSKQLPHLSDYLQALEQRRSQDIGSKLGIAGAIIGSATGLMGALIGVSSSFLRLTPVEGGFLTVGLLAACAAAMGGYYLHLKRTQPKRDPDWELIQEAQGVGKQMLASLNARRLHRDLDPASADLLEISARNWKRVQESLKGPFWGKSDLPEHWRHSRETALRAADRAMAEILVMLQSGFRPNQNPGGIERLFETLEDAGLISTQRLVAIEVPAEFLPAQSVAIRLAELADELDRLSREAIFSDPAGSRFRAESDLRDTLRDLKQYQQAESEIDQELRG